MGFSGRLDQRVLRYARSDSTSDAGDPTTTYTRTPNPAALGAGTPNDGAWWGRYEPVAAGEESVAAAPEMRVTGTVAVRPEALSVGGIQTSDALKVLRGARDGGDLVVQVKGVKPGRALNLVMLDVAHAEGDVLALVEA